MSDSDQKEVIAFLSKPEVFGAGTDAVETVETHISVVFLGRDRVLKLKRAVTFPFLDFSTAERRHEACEAEVRLNRRTAPDLYRGVVAVTREPNGTLRLDGGGEPVDWVIDMARFDETTLFDRQAQRGALTRDTMESLAEAVARFHRDAEVVRTDLGGRAGIAATVESNAATFDQYAEGVLDAAEVARLNRETGLLLDRVGSVLDRRREEGRVRRCHGDLHLRNIYLSGREPTLFDAIEFNETFAVIDALYDLAFLLMDLDHHDLRFLANIVLNRYLDLMDDTGGLSVLPLFLSMRAAIRSFVGAASAHHVSDADAAAQQAADSSDYLAMALGYLEPSAPRLIAVGGLSGSGKSLLARELAPLIGTAPGARVARSDALRKRLAGVGMLTRLGPEAYSPEMSERTYRAVFEEARTALATGHSVVADAVFARPEERTAIAAVADEAGVPFAGLWLEAPSRIMEHRVTRRRRNVSDADARVVRMQESYDLGDISWTRINSSGARNRTMREAKAALGL